MFKQQGEKDVAIIYYVGNTYVLGYHIETLNSITQAQKCGVKGCAMDLTFAIVSSFI